MPAGLSITEKTIDHAERDAQAARLRSGGMTYTQIAQQMGYAGPSGARQAVQRALKAAVREPAAEVIELETLRLDGLWARVVSIVHGSGTSDMTRLHAVDRALRIMERRARLLGLDAPVRHDHRITDAVDAQLEALAAEIGQLTGREPAPPVESVDADL